MKDCKINFPEIVQEIKKFSQRYIHDAFKQENLYSSHLIYLLILRKQGMLTQAELSKGTKNDKAHTNRIVNQLLERNFVEIENSSQVRNQKIKLTQSGNNIAIKMEKLLNNWFEQITYNIPNENLLITHDTLRSMLYNAQNINMGDKNA